MHFKIPIAVARNCNCIFRKNNNNINTWPDELHCQKAIVDSVELKWPLNSFWFIDFDPTPYYHCDILMANRWRRIIENIYEIKFHWIMTANKCHKRAEFGEWEGALLPGPKTVVERRLFESLRILLLVWWPGFAIGYYLLILWRFRNVVRAEIQRDLYTMNSEKIILKTKFILKKP